MIHLTRIELINGTKSAPLPIDRYFNTPEQLDKYRARLKRIMSARLGHDVMVCFTYKTRT